MAEFDVTEVIAVKMDAYTKHGKAPFSMPRAPELRENLDIIRETRAGRADAAHHA
jgi:hypothetical protein